jgi:hypothetical protein
LAQLVWMERHGNTISLKGAATLKQVRQCLADDIDRNQLEVTAKEDVTVITVFDSAATVIIAEQIQTSTYCYGFLFRTAELPEVQFSEQAGVESDSADC